MADTFSNDLRLRLQESGSNAGTWGDLLNGTITNIASALGQGSEAIPNASTHTITLADGTADEARSLYLKCTGGGQACTVTLGPNTISKVWIIDNATSYTLTFSQGSGANVAIAAGAVKVIATDGAGSGAAVVDTLDGLSLSNLAVTGTIKLNGNYPTGTGNVAVGDTALDSIASGAQYNVAIGSAAGTAVTTGIMNTLIGSLAGDAITDGKYNIALGKSALSADTSGNRSIAIGLGALETQNFTSDTDAYNIGIGHRAGTAVTTGVQNTIIGGLAGDALTTGQQNTVLGYGALTLDTLGIGSVAIGRAALEAQNFTTATSSLNTAVGYHAGLSVTTGNANTFIGGRAGDATTTGSTNVAVGTDALGSNTTAANNIAIGYDSLTANTTGVENVGIGSSALSGVTTGFENIGIGRNTGQGITTGYRNTFIGDDAGYLITGGSENTIIGRFTGSNGGLDITNSSNNIVLSDGAGNPRLTVNTAGQIAFGTSNGSTDIAGGTIGLALNDNDGRQMLDSRTNSNINTYRQRFYNTNGLVGAILTNGSTTSFSSLSDYRLKENVVYDWDATARLQQLKPVRFNFIADPTTTIDGFLAHEVQAVVPEAVSGEKDATDDNGIVSQSLDPAKIVPLLVKAIQEQQTLIESLTDRITALEG